MRIRILDIIIFIIALVLMAVGLYFFNLSSDKRERNEENISRSHVNLEYWYRHSGGRLEKMGGPIGIGYNMKTSVEDGSYNVFIGECESE